MQITHTIDDKLPNSFNNQSPVCKLVFDEKEELATYCETLTENEAVILSHIVSTIGLTDEMILDEIGVPIDIAGIFDAQLLYQNYFNHIIDKYSSDYNAYKSICLDMKKSTDWFRDFQSIYPAFKPYRVVLGLTKTQWVGDRVGVESFVVGGQCHYNSSLYINTYRKYPSLHKKFIHYMSNHIFFHEFSHAMIYSGVNFYKKREKKYISDSTDFVELVKKNWRVAYYPYLIKKDKKLLNYFLMPSRHKTKIDWTRPAEETFCEASAYIMNYILHGFCPMHIFMLKNKNHIQAVILHFMKPAIFWLLENVLWGMLFPTDKRVLVKLKKFKRYLDTLGAPDEKHIKKFEDLRGHKYNANCRKGFDFT